jgi:tRNA A-37 threonylcarbamoyl transferase component Bud32
MVSLQESVRSQCPDLDRALLARHFDSLPASYFERYSVADVVRHLRLLAHLTPAALVDVEVRPLAAHAFEVTVVGTDQPGTVACITTALAALAFSLEDVQVAPYLDAGGEPDALPRYFVIVLRVSGSLHGRPLAEFTDALRERLRQSFAHLEQGDLLAAQAVAAETRVAPADGTAVPGRRSGPVPRPSGYEGMLLGGDFRLQRKIASGGICEVYQASQLSLNRVVAVKLFHHEGADDADLYARFNQEAVVLAQFSCPQIVPILAAGTTADPAGGTLGWMAMEYVGGGDLARYVQGQGPPLIEVGLRWLRDALEGLAYAHRRGVLHRDIKPHNLLLTADGAVKVSDFGLLKQVQPGPSGLTPRSIIMGTPHYMSPEQTLGEALDERSDVFSLGTTFFYVFAGQLPFDRTSPAAVLVQISQEDAPRLDEVAPHVPRPLTLVLGRMMARRREERYQEVGVVLEDLASYERRGLLTFAEAGTLAGLRPPARSDAGQQTQAYKPAPKAGEATP